MIIKDNSDLEKNPDFKNERFLLLKQKINESLLQFSPPLTFIPGFYDQLILHSLLYENHKAIFPMARQSSKTYGILLMASWRAKLYSHERIIIFTPSVRLIKEMVNALKIFISRIDKSYDVKKSCLYSNTSIKLKNGSIIVLQSISTIKNNIRGFSVKNHTLCIFDDSVTSEIRTFSALSIIQKNEMNAYLHVFTPRGEGRKEYFYPKNILDKNDVFYYVK